MHRGPSSRWGNQHRCSQHLRSQESKHTPASRRGRCSSSCSRKITSSRRLNESRCKYIRLSRRCKCQTARQSSRWGIASIHTRHHGAFHHTRIDPSCKHQIRHSRWGRWCSRCMQSRSNRRSNRNASRLCCSRLGHCKPRGNRGCHKRHQHSRYRKSKCHSTGTCRDPYRRSGTF